MSELIAMRHRIKAIESTKKITHAMRLIAMSTHARLRTEKKNYEEYKEALFNLVKKLSHHVIDHPIIHPKSSEKSLVIIIGSQKGLCGTFNQHLMGFVERNIKKAPRQDVFVIGKKIAELLEDSALSIVKTYSLASVKESFSIAHDITQHILHNDYANVTVFYNYPKTFFAQQPRREILIPFVNPSKEPNASLEEYHLQEDQNLIFETVITMALQAVLYENILQSLIAEQAARFLAMDNSTRNASTLLDTMKLQYNKLRQTKITRELTDLSASF